MADQSETKKAQEERKKRGRPSYKATQKDRDQVAKLSGLGMTAEGICDIMGFSRSTLFKYFGDELKVGGSSAGATVMSKAFTMATSGKHPAMTMFWLKCREGWRETQTVTHEEVPAVIVTTSDKAAEQ
jgi:hypothetical protein